MALEGNELEQSYDSGAGKLIIDVTDKGSVRLANEYVKDIAGYARIKSITEIESNIFKIAKEISKKTATKWDDAAIEGLMKLLGIQGEEAMVLAKAELLDAPVDAMSSEDMKA